LTCKFAPGVEIPIPKFPFFNNTKPSFLTVVEEPIPTVNALSNVFKEFVDAGTYVVLKLPRTASAKEGASFPCPVLKLLVPELVFVLPNEVLKAPEEVFPLPIATLVLPLATLDDPAEKLS